MTVHIRVHDETVPGAYEYGYMVTLCGIKFTVGSPYAPVSWHYRANTYGYTGLRLGIINCKECLDRGMVLDLGHTDL